MKNFRQLFLKRPKLLIGALCTLALFAIYASVYAAMQLQQPPELVQTGNNQESDVPRAEKVLSIVQPELANESSSVLLLGTVISNETANIYPRRDGIVEDVLVDIGDAVQKNQIVALLLPKGVEGQSTAAIAEKKARQEQAKADYTNAQSVKDETITSTLQKIKEKETEIEIALREQESLAEQFSLREEDVIQKREQSFNAVSATRQLTEHILIGSNSRAGSAIYEEDILDELGLLSFQTRYDVIPPFDQLYTAENEYESFSGDEKASEIFRIITLADNALLKTHALLSATPTVPNPTPNKYTHQELSALITQVLNLQDRILKSKEQLQDAKSALDALIASEPNVYRAYVSGKMDGIQSNKVSMLETQLGTLQSNLELTEANQQQMVDRHRTTVDIATAQLQSEYARSGHRQIRSPFSGTVSKRFIDVGQIVMPSMPAFELTDVPTSLAKKAKTEIQFGLPEAMFSAVDVGDTITFHLQTDDTKELTAEVTRKSPQVDLQTQTVIVQAKIPDDTRLPHQTSVRIRLIDENNPVYRVPSSVVKRGEDKNFVWMVDKETGLPVQILVSVIAEDGEFAEVTGSISEDSQLILDPPDFIHD